MAKKGDKTNIYLLAMVGIVAAVGIVVLIMNAGTTAYYEGDMAGQAIKARGDNTGFFAQQSYAAQREAADPCHAPVKVEGSCSAGSSLCGVGADAGCCNWAEGYSCTDTWRGWRCCPEPSLEQRKYMVGMVKE